MRRAAAIALIALSLIAVAAHALDPERAIRQLPHTWYEDRLPQNTVLSIAQHADGAIWLATYGGLVRYSGGEFELIDRRRAPALRSTAITGLLEDDAKTLWVGTLNGGLYRSRGRGFEAVALPPGAESVFRLAQDRRGGLWLATSAGIVRRDANGTQVFGPEQGFVRGPYRAMLGDAAGGLWIAVDGAGVVHHDTAGKTELLELSRGLPSLSVYSLSIDRAGTLWAATQQGLARYHAGRFERDPRLSALDDKRIHAVLGDREGNLWMVAQGEGICRLTAERFDCQRAARGLSNDVVRAIFEDREGNLWLGATNSGLHRISDSKLVSVTGRIESNSIRAVYEDAAGTVWVGTDGAGLARYDGQALVPSGLALPSPFLRSLAGDTEGNLWIGTIEGLSRRAPDGTLRSFTPREGLPGAIVFAVTPAREGGVWVGTMSGLARVVADELTPVKDELDDIRSLYEDGDGRLWLGLRSGLRCRQDSVRDTCGTDGLPNTSVFAFHGDADGSVWLGTSRGLMRWRDGRVSVYAEAAGLADETLFAILDDGNGNLWVSTNRGLARIARDELDALDRGERSSVQPAWFGKSDGMLSSQGNGASQTPGWRGRDGRLWFGTANGVVRVDAAALRLNPLPPPVAIEGVRVDGIDVDPANLQGIGPGVDRLEFRYAGMSFVAPEAVRYRYRLEGYDRGWIEAGAARAASYTNLPPGDYTFHAAASNNDGVWNDTGASLSFSIVPSLAQTTWFRVLMALGALAVLAGVYRLRLWRLRANERALRREVATHTEALRNANAELRRLASLDGLTRIANRGAFDQALHRLWEDHRRRNARFAVLLCDIDAFKAYNDRYGHPAGDTALIRVAGALAGMVRYDVDMAARYGGEEMVLLLADCDEPEAKLVAQRLLDAVRALRIEHAASGVAPWVTISIGVAVIAPTSADLPESAVQTADEALYRAKAEGRDRANMAPVG